MGHSTDVLLVFASTVARAGRRRRPGGAAGDIYFISRATATATLSLCAYVCRQPQQATIRTTDSSFISLICNKRRPGQKHAVLVYEHKREVGVLQSTLGRVTQPETYRYLFDQSTFSACMMRHENCRSYPKAFGLAKGMTLQPTGATEVSKQRTETLFLSFAHPMSPCIFSSPLARAKWRTGQISASAHGRHASYIPVDESTFH
jgi:hypothetical protein